MTQQEDWEAVARKRIKRVSKILGPDRDKTEVEKTVWAMIVEQRLRSERRLRSRNRGADFLRPPINKKEKEAIARVAKAARRLGVTLKHPALPNCVKKLFPTDQEKTTSELEKLALKSLPKPRRHPPPHLPRRAAQYAVYLLQLHNLPVRTTRGGQAHKLAAAIYGAERPDTFNHLRFYRDVQIYSEFDDLTRP